MAKAKMTPPVLPEVKLTLTHDEARWLSAVVAHVNSCSNGTHFDADIWTALSDAGVALNEAERREILRTYDTDYGIFLGESE